MCIWRCLPELPKHIATSSSLQKNLQTIWDDLLLKYLQNRFIGIPKSFSCFLCAGELVPRCKVTKCQSDSEASGKSPASDERLFWYFGDFIRVCLWTQDLLVYKKFYLWFIVSVTFFGSTSGNNVLSNCKFHSNCQLPFHYRSLMAELSTWYQIYSSF